MRIGGVDSYIPQNHEPHAKSITELYAKGIEELALPAPAVRLLNFPLLNKMTGGFRGYEFTILCGATGSGKTTLMAEWSRGLLEQNVPHFIASVETGATDFVKRTISSIAAEDWNTGDPVPLQKLKQFHANFGFRFQSESAWLSLYDNRMKIEVLMADIAWMVKNKGVKIAFIDNLNFFLEVTSAKDQIVEMDRVIHELIIFCKRVDVHVVMIMHPKKTNDARVESEFDVKGSATAVQEAHNVLLFNRPHPDLVKAGTASHGDRELLIAKMRRKGKFVRRRLILRCIDGVRYEEGLIV